MCTIPCRPASPVFTERIFRKQKFNFNCYDTLAFTINTIKRIKWNSLSLQHAELDAERMEIFIICVKPKFMVMVWSFRSNHTKQTFQFPFECITKNVIQFFCQYHQIKHLYPFATNWQLDRGLSESFFYSLREKVLFMIQNWNQYLEWNFRYKLSYDT